MLGKKPGAMASAFSWLSTEMKMLMQDDSREAAKIMMDGCNMGIQSISEALNKNADASREAKALAKKLVLSEETFLKEMEKYL